MRILVVEDEAKVARALREGLEREKYEVVVAPTVEEGFFLINAEKFDLVACDNASLPARRRAPPFPALHETECDTLFD